MAVAKNSFYFFSLAATGKGISGGDRIFIELARRWSKNLPVKIFTTEEGVDMMKRQGLSGRYLRTKKIEKSLPKNFILKYLYKIIIGIKLGFTLGLPNSHNLQTTTYLYLASHFWMDFFPALILKLRFPNSKLLVGWYQTAPNPLVGFAEVEREEKYKLTALAHWIVQFPLKPLIKRYADIVVVNNEDERKQFSKKNKKGDVIVLIGAVRLKEIDNWKLKVGNLPKVYDAVFQGRFHAQKGVVELVDVWKKVVEKKQDAKLAMIGDGPLMHQVESQITNYKLQNNVKLFGYVFDGPKKYKIFSQSKLVVHPAFYDSGGMASAEAMAFEIPAVGFNLKAYDSYYPKGMLKVEKGNLNDFAITISELLSDDVKRIKLGKEAESMIKSNWDWDKRAQELLDNIKHAKKD